MSCVMKRTITILALGLVLTGGCSDNPNNTELCRDVYEAFCHRADECGAIESLRECLRFYRDDCRTRRLPPNVLEPTEDQVDECLAATAEMSCNDLDPTLLDECSFLVPPDSDAGPDDTEREDGGAGDDDGGPGDGGDGGDDGGTPDGGDA